jgi:hypothetical protein
MRKYLIIVGGAIALLYGTELFIHREYSQREAVWCLECQCACCRGWWK